MATWRCEISLLALKNISRVSAANEIFSSTREEKSRISTRSCDNLHQDCPDINKSIDGTDRTINKGGNMTM